MIEFRNAKARIPEWRCEKGERWLLSAPTGWGKTVWLKQVALLRDAGSSEVHWRGTRVTPETLALYRSQWMYVPQTGFRSTETVAQHLASVLALRTHTALAAPKFLADFRAALATMGLGHVDPERRTLQDVSGGELQAVSLVRSVLLAPEGLFLDEPTSAMDAALAQRVEAWIRDHHLGAWVWITHDAGQAQRLLQTGSRSLRG